ncbi:hypothetical protein [Nitratireductor sp. XY-223]|uniref:hypothetical protein n=1 Tax=Nitratireductor sp. XY-223 TaxID=2561926 RepID=UPI0010A9EA4B|nr:hypothetical protein [Nitratireductor sp. XY-223]
MIDTLLNALGGFLNRTFMFASFLPALLFISANVLFVVLMIGPGSVAVWYGALDGVYLTLLPFALFVGTFVLAYIYASLRGPTLLLWSGRLIWIPLLTRELLQYNRERYIKLRAIQFEEDQWGDLVSELREQLDPHWNVTQGKSELDAAGRRKARRVMAAVEAKEDPALFMNILEEQIVPLFVRYKPDELRKLYRFVNQTLLRRSDKVDKGIDASRIQFDLDYGSYARIRPTRLGNIVESYNDYPDGRYGMSGVLFWPRLVQVTPDNYNTVIQDKKAYLDFSLAMANSAAVTAVLIPAYGPWVNGDVSWFAWFIASLFAAIVAGLSYEMAVPAAKEFGSTLRAACDLFRLDLMDALNRPRPEDLEAERAQWTELHQLAAYGTIQNFTLKEIDEDKGS